MTFLSFGRIYASLRLATGEFIDLRRSDGELITTYSETTLGHERRRRSQGSPRLDAPGVHDVDQKMADGSLRRQLVASTMTADFGLRVEIGRDERAMLEGWRSETWVVVAAVLLAAFLTTTLLWTVLRRWHALEVAATATTERAEAVLARRDVEEALLQAQKMDALGQLAGGIAHDFNNMLTLISGCLELLRRRLEPTDPSIQRCLGNADEGIRRATALTARLLCFARKEQVRHVPIDVNVVIEGLAELLGRTLGGGMGVLLRLDPGLGTVRGDASQLENAILNLCVNARDAMPQGGDVSISTSSVVLKVADPRAPELEEGAYVEITVRDTGSGIPEEVKKRIFEPFFTTKGAGKGTGLGLSQVFAFARDAGGGMAVDSTLGEGTAFRIYLRRCAGNRSD